MHQDIEPWPAVNPTEDTPRAELEEAMGFIVQTLQRMPSHWTDRRAALHAKLDAMLGDWERTGDGRAPTPDA